MWIFVLFSVLIAGWAVRETLWQDGRVPADLVRNRYRLEQTLGHGGVSVVWRAHDLQLGRQVAVKQLTPAALDDPVALERVHREARTIAGLAHPNIVALHDFGFDDQAPYLVLELVDGPSLAAILVDGPLPIVQTADIARQTRQALAAAHAAGVIHRDIKPANLLLRPDGLVKVCDFGIAHLQNTPTLSPPAGGGEALGTSHYMAPETVSGDPVDARTDLYAVGCLLYAMLTGHPPFTGDNPVGVGGQHLHDTPVAVHRPSPRTPRLRLALWSTSCSRRTRPTGRAGPTRLHSA